MKAKMTSFDNAFFKYLCGFIWFDQDRLEALMKQYPIGATEQGEPIFWHINAEHKITNGRILTMDSEKGKVYDASWYYQDGRPTCLFGEYLLDSFPTQTVALVKDEMTAAIMSCFPTPYVWLATGKEKATPTDLLPLAGKSVVVFPDKGEYSKWQETLQAVPNLYFHVSDVMEKVQGDCHTIAQMVLSQQPLRPTEAEAALMRMEAILTSHYLSKHSDWRWWAFHPPATFPRMKHQKRSLLRKNRNRMLSCNQSYWLRKNAGMAGTRNATSVPSRMRESTAPIVASSIGTWSMGKVTAA